MSNAKQIVQRMWEADAFSQWLAINRDHIEEGSAVLSMIVRPEMCNGFGIAHGAITYALADSALAFASNSRGKTALSLETSISHIHPVYTGDRLTATTTEKHSGHRIGIYEIMIHNQDSKLVALFKGTVYYKNPESSTGH